MAGVSPEFVRAELVGRKIVNVTDIFDANKKATGHLTLHFDNGARLRVENADRWTIEEEMPPPDDEWWGGGLD